ncbi:FCD domain-containing protein (plasmid) [Deinococcus taeanensis]|uniref:FCD domain-containing protein n=1 Tax=Deinococcus taeanensis TaxID=2737050 RepID=UPI001CDB9360|nr:FCD domain-containing protein [Deinococcus taeanensis]
MCGQRNRHSRQELTCIPWRLPAGPRARRAAPLQLALPTQDAAGADTAVHQVWTAGSGNHELQRPLGPLKRKRRRTERASFNAAAPGEASLAEHAAVSGALRPGDLERGRNSGTWRTRGWPPRTAGPAVPGGPRTTDARPGPAPGGPRRNLQRARACTTGRVPVYSSRYSG